MTSCWLFLLLVLGTEWFLCGNGFCVHKPLFVPCCKCEVRGNTIARAFTQVVDTTLLSSRGCWLKTGPYLLPLATSLRMGSRLHLHSAPSDGNSESDSSVDGDPTPTHRPNNFTRQNRGGNIDPNQYPTKLPPQLRTPFRRPYQANSPHLSQRLNQPASTVADSRRRQEEQVAIATNKRIMEMQGPADLVSFFRGDELRNFTPVNLATAIHRLAKLDRDSKAARAAAAAAATAELEDGAAARSADGIVNEVQDAWRAFGQRMLAVAGQFDARGLSNVMWALAALRAPPAPRLRDALLGRLPELAPQMLPQNENEFNPQNVANTLGALAKLEVGANKGLVAAISRRVVETAGEFNPQNLGSTLWALATLGVGADEELVAALSRQAKETAREFKPQAVGNTLWALATLGVAVDEGLVAALSRQAVETAREFNPQNVANTLWALATLGVGADAGLVAALSRQAIDTAREFNPQAVGITLWALATLGVGVDEKLVAALSRQAEGAAREFNPQNVANTLWALATLGVGVDEGLLAALSRQAKEKATEFNPQAVGNTLWALATLGVGVDLGLVAALSRQAERTAREFNPQNVANTLWALATLGVGANAGLVAALSRRAIETAGKFKPQEVANTLWALATLGVGVDDELVAALSRQATETAREFNPQAVANTLCALATLGVGADVGLLAALSVQAVEISGDFKPQEATNMLCALATLDVRGLQLAPGLAIRLLDAFLSGVQLPASGSARSFTVNAVAADVREICGGGTGAGEELAAFDARHMLSLARLHQVFLYHELEGGFQELCDLALSSLRSRSRSAFEEASRRVTRSRFQAEVAATVEELGWDFREEVADPITAYSLDILVRDSAPLPYSAAADANGTARGAATWGVDGLGCVVEADGPTHFLPVPARSPWNGGQTEKAMRARWRANGATKLKRRLLRRAGYRVASVAFWEWEQAASGSDRCALLARVVAKAGASPAICPSRAASLSLPATPTVDTPDTPDTPPSPPPDSSMD